jgi:Cu/Zn superoxide dismutase
LNRLAAVVLTAALLAAAAMAMMAAEQALQQTAVATMATVAAMTTMTAEQTAVTAMAAEKSAMAAVTAVAAMTAKQAAMAAAAAEAGRCRVFTADQRYADQRQKQGHSKQQNTIHESTPPTKQIPGNVPETMVAVEKVSHPWRRRLRGNTTLVCMGEGSTRPRARGALGISARHTLLP